MTSTTISAGEASARTVIGAPGGAYLIAFSSRLISTCWIDSAVERDQREVARDLHLEPPAGQLVLDARHRRPDHLLDRLPLLAEVDAAGLDARHLEQVGEQTV